LEITLIGPGRPIPQNADLIILPGSKSTRADLGFLRAEGWDTDIKAHHRANKPVLGICGGFQMLGTSIADPLGIEGPPGTDEGLGLLDVSTVLESRKNLAFEPATHVASGTVLAGYRMHMGATNGPDCARPFATIGKSTEGATSATGRVMGTYLHGLFAGDEFRQAFFGALGAQTISGQNYEHTVEATLDAWAAHLNSHLDIDALLALAGPVK
ncbi:MAG: cobyric acid synthase CobQ, partial [Alphaproteobacteria bacterium]|nr:cobyric acid synthase CobQ [Alphaproteobacteria bacterium]